MSTTTREKEKKAAVAEKKAVVAEKKAVVAEKKPVVVEKKPVSAKKATPVTREQISERACALATTRLYSRI